MKKFKKAEKKRCKYYCWGKCLSQGKNQDCKPLTENGTLPDKIEECKDYEDKLA